MLDSDSDEDVPDVTPRKPQIQNSGWASISGKYSKLFGIHMPDAQTKATSSNSTGPGKQPCKQKKVTKAEPREKIATLQPEWSTYSSKLSPNTTYARSEPLPPKSRSDPPAPRLKINQPIHFSYEEEGNWSPPRPPICAVRKPGPSVPRASPSKSMQPIEISDAYYESPQEESYIPPLEVDVADDEKTTRNKDALATTLTGDVVNYYTKEMERLMAKEMHQAYRLRDIHSTLVGNLLDAFTPAFKFAGGANYQTKITTLTASLTTKFEIYRRENDEKLRRRQEGITQSLHKAKSSYVGKIEDVLKQNPAGMNENELKRQQNEIAKEETKSMELDIKQTVGQNEPLGKHVKAFKKYVDEYWECVHAMNTLNLRKGKLREGQAPTTPSGVPRSSGPGLYNAEEDTLGSISSRSAMEVSVARETEIESVAGTSQNEHAIYRLLLLDRCQEVKGQLEAGNTFKFKSSIVKELFAKKIKEAIDIAQDLNSSQEQLEDHMETIVTWSTRHAI